MTTALTRNAPDSVSSIRVSSRRRATSSRDDVSIEWLVTCAAHVVNRGAQSRPPGRWPANPGRASEPSECWGTICNAGTTSNEPWVVGRLVSAAKVSVSTTPSAAPQCIIAGTPPDTSTTTHTSSCSKRTMRVIPAPSLRFVDAATCVAPTKFWLDARPTCSQQCASGSVVGHARARGGSAATTAESASHELPILCWRH